MKLQRKKGNNYKTSTVSSLDPTWITQSEATIIRPTEEEEEEGGGGRGRGE